MGSVKIQTTGCTGLAFRLRAWDIKPCDVRKGDKTQKVYNAEDLWDAWEQFLPPPSEKTATFATDELTDEDLSNIPWMD